ncbi:MAG: competence/damage-inducible protein A [Bacteroidales bacterium]|nr:competence/damage-inducible protein A [Bacteroidales bacterium]MBN2755551.1 competence/damage-inducible protein A [Bacteroidales bacterium]
MKAEIITIGDEILIGQIIDSNSAWIAEQLNLNGIKVNQILSISDSEKHILDTLSNISKETDIVIMTGGLGPTKDDITKKTLCNFFDSKLIFNDEVFKDIEKFFETRNIPLLEENRKQAELPEKCTVIRNYFGTASGMWFEKNGQVFVSLPGIPFEMKELISGGVIPLIKEKFKLPVIIHRTILTHGIPESSMAKIIEDWETNLNKNLKLAYLPSPEHLRLRLSIIGDDKKELESIIEYAEIELTKLIKKSIFGYEKQTLQEVIGIILKERNATLSTAESCTGGNIARLITSINGSSSYFKGSVIAYSNEIKEKILNVNKGDIEKHGAVSKEVVTQMALGIKKLFNTDYAIATSGIAGPDGGTDEKPIGTTWIAVAGPDGISVKKYSFGTRRDINIRRASSKALDKLRKFILNYDD